MFKSFSIISTLTFVLLVAGSPVPSSDLPIENRVLAGVQKMESFFKTVEDYSCEVEQVFYKDGLEDQRYRFKFYFKREKKSGSISPTLIQR